MVTPWLPKGGSLRGPCAPKGRVLARPLFLFPGHPSLVYSDPATGFAGSGGLSSLSTSSCGAEGEPLLPSFHPAVAPPLLGFVRARSTSPASDDPDPAPPAALVIHPSGRADDPKRQRLLRSDGLRYDAAFYCESYGSAWVDAHYCVSSVSPQHARPPLRPSAEQAARGQAIWADDGFVAERVGTDATPPPSPAARRPLIASPLSLPPSPPGTPLPPGSLVHSATAAPPPSLRHVVLWGAHSPRQASRAVPLRPFSSSLERAGRPVRSYRHDPLYATYLETLWLAQPLEARAFSFCPDAYTEFRDHAVDVGSGGVLLSCDSTLETALALAHHINTQWCGDAASVCDLLPGVPLWVPPCLVRLFPASSTAPLIVGVSGFGPCVAMPEGAAPGSGGGVIPESQSAS